MVECTPLDDALQFPSNESKSVILPRQRGVIET
jgi:hypothetical protein